MNNPRKIRRRLAVTVLAIFAVVSLFVVRLVDIQVVQAETLNTQSLSKRSIAEIDYGSRGNIVDSSGTVLADSVDRFDITAAPNVVNKFTRLGGDDGKTKVEVSVQQAISELSAITKVPVAKITTALTEKPDSNFAYVAKSMTLDELNQIKKLDIPWIYPKLHPGRTYPNGSVAGNLVGFIGTDGPQAGLELSENSCVGSTDGSSVYERGADGIRIPGSTVTTKAAKEGGTLKLTIDNDFQWFAQQSIAERVQELQAVWGTVMVVRVSDGAVMAAADYPTVDPNNVDGSAVTDLGSRAFSTPYEPGSTMKSLTIASLLDAGVITPTTEVTAPGRRTVSTDAYVKDAWAHGDIRYTATGVLVNSSNTGISLLADKLGKDERRDYMIKFGLNADTAVDFTGESSGYVPPTKDWDALTNYAVQFGQGMTTTSAQMASIYQTLGNGGVRMPLHMVAECDQADGTVTDVPSTTGVRAVSEAAADTTVKMMENVVTQGGLTKELTIPGYRVAAKTGTAEVAGTGGTGYGSDRVISVAGLVPADNPQYAIVVTIGNPVTMKTSSAVSEIFQKITNQVIKSFKIAPSTGASPIIPVTW